MEAGDAGLAFGPEAAKALSVSLSSADSQHQCERRNNAGMQSPHDCNPFLLNLLLLFQSKLTFNFSVVEPCPLIRKQCASSNTSNQPNSKAKVRFEGEFRRGHIVFRFTIRSLRLLASAYSETQDRRCLFPACTKSRKGVAALPHASTRKFKKSGGTIIWVICG